jgi:ribonuclease HI
MSGVDLHQPQAVYVVHTDASLEGWGAHCTHLHAQGRWSNLERSLHINILELKAVLHAVKAFAKFLINKPVQIATDNTTVVAYINKQGGTHSWELCALLWRILTWCHQRNIVLSARHIPGCLNVVADQLSRKGQALHTEWSLHPQIFQDICQIHGAPMIDLFATRFNNKLPLFVSPVPDPKALAVDAMSMDWARRNCYAFPPTACIPQVLRKLLEAPGCRLMLVAPYWPTKTWFLELRQRSLYPPVPLPQVWYLLKQPRINQFHQNLRVLNLHVWWLKGGQI